MWVGVQAIEQILGNRLQISTANSGGSLFTVQSVSGGCKLDPKFAVQSDFYVQGRLFVHLESAVETCEEKDGVS